MFLPFIKYTHRTLVPFQGYLNRKFSTNLKKKSIPLLTGRSYPAVIPTKSSKQGRSTTNKVTVRRQAENLTNNGGHSNIFSNKGRGSNRTHRATEAPNAPINSSKRSFSTKTLFSGLSVPIKKPRLPHNNFQYSPQLTQKAQVTTISFSSSHPYYTPTGGEVCLYANNHRPPMSRAAHMKPLGSSSSSPVRSEDSLYSTLDSTASSLVSSSETRNCESPDPTFSVIRGPMTESSSSAKRNENNAESRLYREYPSFAIPHSVTERSSHSAYSYGALQGNLTGESTSHCPPDYIASNVTHNELQHDIRCQFSFDPFDGPGTASYNLEAEGYSHFHEDLTGAVKSPLRNAAEFLRETYPTEGIGSIGETIPFSSHDRR